ncbi:AAA family ATPase [Paucibacter sp. R3-3]|uniref:AAA family ATPase n=1 Tax=Roseateles agri TaxID=3098619 RepID=A0ABU5DK92_9BURK|nr:AAA family ATPase [Paucibacter sp. R3-3]MDY0746544.1 AAA family ATPase [Paucibacter sp. R3-3]
MEPLPPVRLLRGDAVALEPIEWLWNGYLPAGMLVLLGGAPGCGKTTLALSLAAVVTTAGVWPDGSKCTDAGDVIIWSGEDPPPVIAARLVAAGADMKRVHFVYGLAGEGARAFDPGRDMVSLQATLQGLAAPRLLILDPIVSAVAGDGHKSNEVRRALQPVIELGQRLGCTIVGITHFSKGTGGRDPVERITGSLAFAAQARLVLVAAKGRADGEERRVVVRAKSNVGPDEGGFAYQLKRVDVADGVVGQCVEWLGAVDGSAREILSALDGADDERDGPRSDIEAFIRGCFAGGPITSKQFEADARGAGYEPRTVQRMAKRMGASSRKDGMRGGWTWHLDTLGSGN